MNRLTVASGTKPGSTHCTISRDAVKALDHPRKLMFELGRRNGRPWIKLTPVPDEDYGTIVSYIAGLTGRFTVPKYTHRISNGHYTYDPETKKYWQDI